MIKTLDKINANDRLMHEWTEITQPGEDKKSFVSGNKRERTTRGNRQEHWLTPGETRIVEWIRRSVLESNGRDWHGIIRHTSGSDMYLLYDGRPAGRVSNE